MHVLDADGPAISLPHGGDQFTQRGEGHAVKGMCIERAVQVGFRQREFGEFQTWVGAWRFAKWIEMSEEMTEVSVGEY